MKTKTLYLSLLMTGSVFMTQAQDLISKVPETSNLLVTINNKAVFKHLDINDVNQTFTRLGVFDKLFKDNDNQITQLQDSGIDFNSNAYFFGEMGDSIQYIGGLIPLTDASRFESLLSSERKIETVNGLKTVYSTDRTLRVSWDNSTVYLLGGIAVAHYFDRADVIERYGLPISPYSTNYGYDYYDDTAVEAEAYDSYWDDEDAAIYADTVMTDVDTATVIDHMDSIGNPRPKVSNPVISEPVQIVVAPPALPNEMEDYDAWDDYALADSVASQYEYSDDYYTEYSEYSRKKDSVVNTIIHEWVNDRMQGIVNGSLPSMSSRTAPKLPDNTIADVRLYHMGSIYQALYPLNALFVLGMGVSSDVSKLTYGIEELSGQLVVDNNVLIFRGDVGLDKEMTTYYKAIYKKKINRKFLRFLDKDALGFMSFNMDTEASVKYMPAMLEKYYGPLSGKYNDFVSLGATFLDIALDEKAIAKVFKGDNLLVLSGITQTEVSYTDYEYDDDYNYTEVEKTKTETIPQFLWMFSSDDMRIFEKIIQIGIRENGVDDMDGIYAVRKKERDPIQVYVLMKDGIVFVGNDLQKIQNIQSDSHRAQTHKPYVNMVKKNNFSMLFNTKQLPDLIEDLNFPINRGMESTVEEFAQYGDFYIRSSGIKGNRMNTEMGIEFPENKGNALAFLFSIIDRWSLGLR